MFGIKKSWVLKVSGLGTIRIRKKFKGPYVKVNANHRDHLSNLLSLFCKSVRYGGERGSPNSSWQLATLRHHTAPCHPSPIPGSSLPRRAPIVYLWQPFNFFSSVVLFLILCFLFFSFLFFAKLFWNVTCYETKIH